MKKAASNLQQEKLQKLQQQLATENMKISRLEIQNNALSKQLQLVQSSLSWRITAPLRSQVNILASLKNSMTLKFKAIFINKLRQSLLKIYQIAWIKKLAIAFLERFPTIQKYLIALMYKKKTYMSHPYYNNDEITNSVYLPTTTRAVYADLLDNSQNTP